MCNRKIVGCESGGMSDHYLVEGKLRVGMRTVRAKRVKGKKVNFES